MKRLIHKNSPIVHGDFSMSVFLISTKNTKENYAKNHFHPEFEIIWVTKGKFSIIVDHKTQILTENSLCLINSRQTHYISTLSDRGEYYSISFDDRFVDFNFRNALFKNNIETTAEAFLLINRIISEYKKSTIMSEFKLKSMVCDFLSYLIETKELELFQAEKKTINLNNMRQIDSALKYINENYSSELSLENLSAISNFSQSWFSTLFRQVVGQSPISYIKSIRLKNALEFLEKSETPIADIAYNVGFTDVGLFNIAFKKQYAISPQEYRVRMTREQ